MNNRKSKALRRAAELATTGSPSIHYDAYQIPAYKGNVLVVRGTPRRLNAFCTRKAYKAMKRAAIG